MKNGSEYFCLKKVKSKIFNFKLKMSFNSSKFQKEFVNLENEIIQIRQELQTLSSKLAKNENKGERNDEGKNVFELF